MRNLSGPGRSGYGEAGQTGLSGGYTDWFHTKVEAQANVQPADS